MLSETTITHLSALTFRANAKRKVSWLPLSGIFWEDEMPEFHELMQFPEEDRNQMFRLFGIRLRIWKGETLTQDDQRFWDISRSQMPNWALFQRMHPSVDDMALQNDAERNAEEEFKAFLADADEVSITEKDGVQSISATFQLNKEQQPAANTESWWQRILRKARD